MLHTGFPKTGTTTTQNTYHAQRAALLEHYGLLYPSIAPNHTDAMCTIFLKNPLNHITNKARGLDEAQARDLAKEYRDTLEAEINATDWTTLLISAEGLSNLDAVELGTVRDWLAQWTDAIDVHVYVRHPLSYTRSVIQQHLKGGELLRDMYQDPPMANYKNRIRNLHRAFGADAVNIFAFEDTVASSKGLSQAFLHNVDPRFDLLEPEAKLENASMSLEAAAVLNSLNVQVPMFVDGKPNPERAPGVLNQIMRVKGQKFDLPPQLRARVTNTARADIEALNGFAGRTVFAVPDSVDPDELENTAEPPNRDMVASLARIINGLCKD